MRVRRLTAVPLTVAATVLGAPRPAAAQTTGSPGGRGDQGAPSELVRAHEQLMVAPRTAGEESVEQLVVAPAAGTRRTCRSVSFTQEHRP